LNKTALITLLLGCAAWFSCTTEVLNGQTVKVVRNLPAFQALHLAMAAEVFLSQGEPQSIEIEADKSSLEFIDTEVRGNSLSVKSRDNQWRGLGKVKIFITVPEINQISVSGSGNVVSQTPIRSGDLAIEISGSGNVTISGLEAANISATITGSGNATLVGKCDQASLDATITGSGSLKADELSVAIAGVTLTGSGSARVNALKELETHITGSGNVQYKGNPQINAHSTGSGKTTAL
jgi:hypothetical protein